MKKLSTITKTKIWIAILLAGDYIFTFIGQFKDNFSRIEVNETNPIGIWLFSNFHPIIFLLLYIPELIVIFWIINKSAKWFSRFLCLFLIISEFGCVLGWYQTSIFYSPISFFKDLYFLWLVLFYIAFTVGFYLTYKKEIILISKQ